jgi:hypothetical protein
MHEELLKQDHENRSHDNNIWLRNNKNLMLYDTKDLLLTFHEDLEPSIKDLCRPEKQSIRVSSETLTIIAIEIRASK